MKDIVITVCSIILLAAIWVVLYDSNRFVVKKYTFQDKRIKKRLRAVVLADLHNKCYGKDNERLLFAIRECEPDIILVAGDILTAKPGKSMETALSLMKRLVCDYPVYYGSGNHEHRLKLYQETYGDMGQKYEEALEEMGVVRLVNSNIRLPEYGVTIYGSEIDRCYYRRFGVQPMEKDYLDGLLGKPDETFYTMLLAHNPDYFPQYAQWGADMTFSGHVHGGMVRVPFWGRGVVSPNIRFFPKYDGGLFKQGESTMLLSRGLGMHTIPIRFCNPGELIVAEWDGNVLSS